ncbi:MAG TPA: hypothetical protein VFD75_13485 [Pyrinomonadaceae bacterium]|jgi:hypothetical protein|nr:hypothetical protein [Pyrinomonadaceae bacterium]
MYKDIRFQAHALDQRYKSGARWFFWIAALSLITSLVSFSGGGFGFFLSLGVTQVIDGFARGMSEELGDSVKVVALLFDVFVAGVFVFLGWLALKRQMWSFVLGVVLFALDALILLAFQVWISFAFHVYVILAMSRGYQAGRQLVALEREMHSTAPVPPPAIGQPVVAEATPTQ